MKGAFALVRDEHRLDIRRVIEAIVQLKVLCARNSKRETNAFIPQGTRNHLCSADAAHGDVPLPVTIVSGQ